MIEQRLIVCAPVRPMPGMLPHSRAGYEKVKCPQCDEQMYLGPRSKAEHERSKVPMLCMRCAIMDRPAPEYITHFGGK